MLNDRDLLAKTLQAEAGNQGLGGMLAVGSVISNRLGSGQSWRDVILAPGQFSAWNKVTGYAGGEQGQDMGKIKPSKDAYAAADAILSGNFTDITGGATHYYNPRISNPKWGARGGGDWQKIGAHLFGKAGAFNRGASNMNGQPTAQQMQQMQRQQQQGGGGGLMGFLQNPLNREILTSFSRSSVGEKLNRIASREREYARETERDNKTAQWLMNQPKGRPYAEAIMSGAMTGQQAYERWKAETQRSGTKIGDKLIDPVTGEVIYEDETMQGKLDKEQVGVVNQLNTQLARAYRPYEEIFNGYNLIRNAVQRRDQSETSIGIDDLVVTIAFAKILDPESVVRSEESASVAAAAGGMAAMLNGIKNFLNGEGLLTDPARNQIYAIATETAQTWEQNSKDAYKRVMDTADAYGIPKDLAEKVIAKPQKLNLEPLPSESGGDDDDEQPNGPVPNWAAPLTQEQWNKLSPEKVKDLTKKAREEGKI